MNARVAILPGRVDVLRQHGSVSFTNVSDVSRVLHQSGERKTDWCDTRRAITFARVKLKILLAETPKSRFYYEPTFNSRVVAYMYTHVLVL